MDEFGELDVGITNGEYDDFGETDDFAERRRGSRARGPGVNVARGSSTYQPRPSSGYVTQAQLQTALARVAGQISTNSKAIKTLESRVATLGTEQARVEAALKKEIADRKKQTDKLEQGLRQTRELAALLPLLSKPATITTDKVTAKATQDNIPVGTKVVVDSKDSLSALLPLVLLGGLGGSGDGGDSSNGLLLALLFSQR
jgi:hypothetical protein